MTDRLVRAIRSTIERLLPWFDRDEFDARGRRTEAIRYRSIRARIASERSLHAYDTANRAYRR